MATPENLMYYIDTATGSWGGAATLQFVPAAAIDADELEDASDTDLSNLGHQRGLDDDTIIESVIDDNYGYEFVGETDVLQNLLDAHALTAEDVRSLMSGVLKMARGV